MKNFQQHTVSSIKIIFLGVVLAFGISYVFAWTVPTQAPPGGNTPPPINVSGVTQTKAGSLLSEGYIQAYAPAGGSLGLLNYAGYGGYFYGTGGSFSLNTSGYYTYLDYPNSSWGVYTNGQTYAQGLSQARDFCFLDNTCVSTALAKLATNSGGISSITGGYCAVGQVVQSISSTGVATCVARNPTPRLDLCGVRDLCGKNPRQVYFGVCLIDTCSFLNDTSTVCTRFPSTSVAAYWSSAGYQWYGDVMSGVGHLPDNNLCKGHVLIKY